MKQRWIISDLDSTLAHTHHRSHLINPEDPKSWLEFSMACWQDVPFSGPAKMLRLFHERSLKIVILSGRHEEARSLTVEWLKRYDIPFDDLVLRNNHDPYDHVQYKLTKIRAWLASRPTASPELMLDDWPEVRDAVEESLDIPVFLHNPSYAVRVEVEAK